MKIYKATLWNGVLVQEEVPFRRSTPQPGSGCLANNPLFMNPLQANFNLQVSSPCRHSGLTSYDMGARYFDDIAAEPDSLAFEQDTTQNLVTLEWSNPNFTVHGNPIDTLNSIHLWRNNELIAVLNRSAVQQ